jgi:hypothetical protein
MGKEKTLSLPSADFAEMDLSEEDYRIFNSLTEIALSPEEEEAAVNPTEFDYEEKNVLALHFHPEWVPMELIQKRLEKAFPAAQNFFAIPTQHNAILPMGPFSGVEADVFSRSFGLKIHLLIHLRTEKLKNAHTFVSMVKKTFEYRGLQLLDILAQIAEPDEAVKKEIKKMGFHEESVNLARFYAAKIRAMVEESGIVNTPRAEMLKNRLLTDYIERKAHNDLDPVRLDRLLSLVNHIKKIVKARLNPAHFHSPEEIIEEARALGAGVVIPHPPQFWPALLDVLDVDGWEVWNPSTPNHIHFLIDCLKRRGKIKRPLLAFMGDDTHMSSKIRPLMVSDKGGSGREIGFQPPWGFADVKAALKDAGQSRERTMAEYLSRIS